MHDWTWTEGACLGNPRGKWEELIWWSERSRSLGNPLGMLVHYTVEA